MKKFLIVLASICVLSNAQENNNNKAIQRVVEPQIYAQVRQASSFAFKSNKVAAPQFDSVALKHAFQVGKNISSRGYKTPQIPVLSQEEKVNAYQAQVAKNYNTLVTNLWAGCSALLTTHVEEQIVPENQKLIDSFIDSNSKRSVNEVKNLPLYKEYSEHGNDYTGWGSYRQTRTLGVQNLEQGNTVNDTLDAIIKDKLINCEDNVVAECMPKFVYAKDQYFSSMRAAAIQYDVKSPYRKEDRKLLNYHLTKYGNDLKKQFNEHKEKLVHLMNTKPNQNKNDLHLSDLNEKDQAFKALEKEFENELPNYIEDEKVKLTATLFPPTILKNIFVAQFAHEANRQVEINPYTLESKYEQIKDLDCPIEVIAPFTPAYKKIIEYVRSKCLRNNS